MGTEQRYDIYDLFLRSRTARAPPPPARSPRAHGPRRQHDHPARSRHGARRARRLAADGVEAIAVCFLHAYRNPAHEREAGEIVRACLPEVAVSLSSDVVAELWEYQRLVTTCANAFVQPLMDRYVRRLERELWQRGFRGALTLMHSAGGLVSPETARAFPIRLLESGPAGGGLATAFFGKLAGHDDVISFDMGGTTAKACLIEDGRASVAAEMEAARVHRFKKGSGLPIKAPVIDMIEIGAGGGSIADIDEVGLLRVGPQSAGADPGPACYGRGGTEATVTDANLLLGYYDPGFFLGGRMALDRDAAERALAAVGAKIGLSAIETAWGIHRVVTESMAAAARIHIVEKGKDPRAYAMVGFGGAGPAHAAGVARILGVRELLIPPASGAASALGFPRRAAELRAGAQPSSAARRTGRRRSYRRRAERPHRRNAGASRSRRRRARRCRGRTSADMRLFGQIHEINVALPDGASTTRPCRVSAWLFAGYAARYTSVYEGVPCSWCRCACVAAAVARTHHHASREQHRRPGAKRCARRLLRRRFCQGSGL
jgi:5-oxoprolinase (ATP-hydrolysing)